MGPSVNWDDATDIDSLKNTVSAPNTEASSSVAKAAASGQTQDAFRRKELDPPKVTTNNGVSVIGAFDEAKTTATASETKATSNVNTTGGVTKKTNAGAVSSGTGGASSSSRFDPSKLAVGVTAGPSNIDTLLDTPDQEYFNQVPEMPPSSSLTDNEESKTVGIGEALAITGVAITGVAIAALAAGFASGLLQRYARKKAAQAGVGGMWSKIACVPSFANPINPFVKFPVYSNMEDFQTNDVADLTTAWTFYKGLSRTAHCAITQISSYDGGVLFDPTTDSIPVEPADNWGGWHDFHISIADNKYHVVAFLADGSAIAEKEGSSNWYVIRSATFGEVANGRLVV